MSDDFRVRRAIFTNAVIGWGSTELQKKIFGDDVLYSKLIKEDNDKFENILCSKIRKLSPSDIDNLSIIYEL